jgi:hypothetical protein
VVDGHRLEAGKIWFRFKTFGVPKTSRISFIEIYDGEKKIFGEDIDVKGTKDSQGSFEIAARVR